MAWERRQIESRTKSSLVKQLGRTEGEQLWAKYLTAREILCNDVYPELPKYLPQYTDHSQRHIEDVLDNIGHLVGPNLPRDGHQHLNATDGYCLCLSALFHDVGLIFGRRDHERKVVRVYNWVRNGQPRVSQERHIVMRVVGAHTGTTDTDSRDTVGELPHTHHFKAQHIHLQEIAAVLRFADELAEGPQRTSAFMSRIFGYSDDATIHHLYAACTDIHIDRPGGRIAVTYEIDIDSGTDTPVNLVDDIRQLLTYAFRRIIKLDQERQYAAYYARVLRGFLTTTVQFNFWIDGEPAAIGLTPLVLTDKCVPGDPPVDLEKRDPAYNVDTICSHILELLNSEDRDA